MKTGPNKTNLTHILLLEDEETLARLIQLHLQGRGYSVDIAEDGQRGLEMWESGYYDLIVVDQKMPRLAGLDCIRALRHRGKLPPIIMISGIGSDEVAVEAMKLGALDYVIKAPSPRFLETLTLSIMEGLKRYSESESMRAASEDRNRWLHELKLRVKELGCLYGIEKIFAGEGRSIEVAFQAVANIVPRACQHSDVCYARIRVRDLDFVSDRYRETPWRKSFVLKEFGKPSGFLEIGFLEKPASQQELFTPEEYELLHSIADRLGQFIDQWSTGQQLRATNEELRKLSRAVEQSASAAMITSADGVIEYVNPKFTGMTGYTSEEALGKTPRMLKSGERSPHEYAELWRTIKAGHEWKGEFHNRKKDGTLYWDYSTISPITDSDGVVTHFVAVKEDITHRKEAENLRAAVLRLSALIAGCHTEDEICLVVVEGIRREMGIDRCGLFLGDPKHPPFRGTYGTDMNGETQDEHGKGWDIGRERDVADLFAGAAFKDGFPLGSPDAQPGEEGLCTTLIALRQSGQVFGVISIDNRLSRRNVSDVQMQHVSLLAEVIGNALQAARAREALRGSVEEVQRANEELEAFNRAMIGRENRIIELKEEVNALLAEAKRDIRYPAVWKEGAAEAEGGAKPGGTTNRAQAQ